jgi:hypothetical protein
MIDESNLLKGLVATYPGLRDYFVKNCDQWLHENGTISPSSLFSAASSFCRARFMENDFENSEVLFSFVERCLECGNENIANAAATCFLENITNSPDIARLAVSLMGPLSRNHVKGWDAFHGSNVCGFN